MMASQIKRPLLLFALTTVLFATFLFAGNTAARDGSTAKSGLSTESLSRSRVRRGPAAKSNSQLARRLREGTIISDQNGFFREDGDGATFVSDEGFEFGALPNLNLERVIRLLKGAEESSSIRWSVSGKVTEFSGRNFVLISRAVYKSATPPPVPEHIAP